MGTSLSGLTPATTFDGLLKTSDNDALGTGLKTIGTGDGTDSVLQLSNSQLNVAGQFTVDTDTTATTMNLRGDGLSINQVYQANNTTYNTISMINSAGIQFKNLTNTVAVIRSNNFGLGIGGSTIPSATAHIKGSGATSATTSLLVQNSAGTELMSVDDDGAVRANSIKGINYQNNHLSLGANAEFLNFVSIKAPKIGVNGVVPTDTQAYIKGSGNDATTTSLLVQNSDGADMLKVTDDGTLQINSDATQRFTIANAAGTAQLNFRYNNIYTSGGNYLYIGGAQTIISGNGVPRVIAASTGTTIKGSGATSATTALLVQNSAGTEAFKVRDDGVVDVAYSFTGGAARLPDFIFTSNSAYPTNGGSIGKNNNVNQHVSNIYSKGVTHITDNTTSSTTLDASAKLQVDSTTQGFLPPRMTDAERDAIATPAAGLMIYDTTNNQMNYWNGSTWIAF